MYIAYPNENNVIEAYAMDLVNNQGTEAEIIALYLSRHNNSIAVETLPDTEKMEHWKIVDGQLVVDEAAELAAKKTELCNAVNQNTESLKYQTITVGNNTFDVNAETITNLLAATAPVNWVLANNSTVELSAQGLSDVIAAISARTTSIVTAARVQKDAILAATTMEELDAVDIGQL